MAQEEVLVAAAPSLSLRRNNSIFFKTCTVISHSSHSALSMMVPVMTSKVKVNMFPCENTSLIEASRNDDGDFELKITSTCQKALRFVEGLGPLNLFDLTDKRSSKVFRNFIDSDMSANCLLLPGVMTALWVEAGMIARSMAKKRVPINIEFIDD